MLAQISITNFAIIDKLTVDLNDGFNALTGETGAGKSIIIDAMSAMLGAKIGPEFVRHGTPTARVEGLFDLNRLDKESRAAVRARIIEASLITEDEAEESTLTLSREIHSSGRTVARINGTHVNIQTLQNIGELLVDIHGQTEHQSLLRVPTHIDLLDQYAGLGAERAQMYELITRLRAIRKERESLQRDERELARRADLLQFQVEEIEKAELGPGEDTELGQERIRLMNSERLGGLADSIYGILIEGAGDDEYGGGGGGSRSSKGRNGRPMPAAGGPAVRDALGEASGYLADLVKLDPLLKEEEDTLAGLLDIVEELGRKVRQYRETVEHDPERLMGVEERLSLLHDLKRKYGQTIEEVIEFGRQAAAELDTLTHSEERVAELLEEEEGLLEQAGELAQEMSVRRNAAGRELAGAVELAMRELLMGSIKFATSVTRSRDKEGLPAPDKEGQPGRWAFDTRGFDRVEFLISPNPGEPLKPLSKIASGGETSRLMLAMKSILSDADHTPTLIFDEVDTGVGGRSGQVVGEKLWSLTDHHQVICISHLPQIAAFADAHYKITKLIKDDRTSTRVERLSHNEQITEVAAMLGGTPVSTSSLENAREIIDQADRSKAHMRGREAGEVVRVGG